MRRNVRIVAAMRTPSQMSAAVAKGVGFVPLTEARQLPVGTQVDARRGTLQIVTATAHVGKTQSGTFRGSVFKLGQSRNRLTKGLTTLSLLEGAFRGGPSYAACGAHAASDPIAHAATRHAADERAAQVAAGLGVDSLGEYLRQRRAAGRTWRALAAESGQPESWLRRQAARAPAR